MLNPKYFTTFAPEMIHAGECGRVCLPFTLTRIFQRHNKRRLLALVLASRNPENFTYPKQESDKCPLVCIFRCASQRLAYRRGHSLFILVTGSFRNLYRENKQKEVPRFFYNYTNGAFGANFPQNIQLQ